MTTSSLSEDILLHQIDALQTSDTYRTLMAMDADKSQLSVLQKQRDETTHSRILAWLFSDTRLGFLPIYSLVRLLQRWSMVQHPQNFPQRFSDALATGKCSIRVLNVLQEETTESKGYGSGRVDMVIQCEYRHQDAQQSLYIVLENKVDSPEIQRPYKGQTLYQTDAYYDYFTTAPEYKSADLIFVFLTPVSTRELRGLKPGDPSSCHSPHYIHINYQELYEHILAPLYAQTSMPLYAKEMLGDYIRALSDAALAPASLAVPPMIMTQEQTSLLSQLFDEYEDLIHAMVAAKCSTSDSDTHPELDALAEQLQEVGRGRGPRQRYTINGQPEGGLFMWDVLKAFVVLLMEKGWSDGRARGLTEVNQELRLLLDMPMTKRMLFSNAPIISDDGRMRSKEVVIDGNVYHLTKELSGSKPHHNFTRFRVNVTQASREGRYNFTFEVE